LLAFHAVLEQPDGSCDDALPDNVASPSCPSRSPWSPRWL